MGDLQSMQQDEPQLVRLRSTSPATYCLQNVSGHVPPIHLHHYLGQTWKPPGARGISTIFSHIVTSVTDAGHQLKIELIGVWCQLSWHRPVRSSPFPADHFSYYLCGWICREGMYHDMATMYSTHHSIPLNQST